MCDRDMVSIIKVVRLALRDALLPENLTERVPEQSVMSSPASVAGFDAAGTESLLPVYHFNARAIAALAGRNCRVLDLGSGSGQFLAYLGRHRPDLIITGIELSDGMVEVGRQRLARSGLAARIKLVHGDMRELGSCLSQPVDIVSSVFALHHLGTSSDLAACVGELSKFVGKGASLWLFDHARPRRLQTTVDFPSVFTPNAEPAFCQDSSNSLKAAWNFEELSTALRSGGLLGINSTKAHVLPFYQIHWLGAARPREDDNWVPSDELSPQRQSEARQFQRLFRSAPGVA